MGPGCSVLTRMRAPRRLLGDRAHEADLGVLGGDVGHRARRPHGADHARGDDDAAAVVHARQAVLAGQEGAAHVHGDLRVEGVLRVLGDRRDRALVAGVAEQHVDRPEPGDRALDVGPRGGRVAHVGGDRIGVRAGELPHARARSASLRSTSMTFAPSLRNSRALAKPEAAGASGDDTDLVLQQRHGRLPSMADRNGWFPPM